MKGFMSWLSAKMSVLLFGIALFAAMLGLYNTSRQYHETVLIASDVSLIANTAKLVPDNGLQNITLSRTRTVSLSTSCQLAVDNLNTTLLTQSCKQSEKTGRQVTVKKQGGVLEID